jgi:hypothetical protein
MEEVDGKLALIKLERVRKYTLTKFIVLYLVGEVIREEAEGVIFLQDPSLFLTNNKRNNPKQAVVLQAVRDQIEYVVTELNYFLDEHGNDTYDYKTEFKSPKAVGSIRNEVLRAYAKDRKMKRVKPFALPK